MGTIATRPMSPAFGVGANAGKNKQLGAQSMRPVLTNAINYKPTLRNARQIQSNGSPVAAPVPNKGGSKP